MSEKMLDLRGKKLTDVFARENVILSGVKFTRVLTQEAGVSAEALKENVSVIFYKPYFESFNEQAIRIHIPKLKGSDFPPVIVNSTEVFLTGGDSESFDNLGDMALAQFGVVEVSREGDRVRFTLTFDEKKYSIAYNLTSKVPTDGFELSRFFEFK
jgi:hypothetical protein